MFIAMNRFKVVRGRESDFETVWRTREHYLGELPGFVEFQLLKGPEREDHTLYASHTVWATAEAFKDWTHSEAFRKAHSNAGRNGDLYLGGPQFEGFEVLEDTRITATPKPERLRAANEAG
jgi:heme-degrading monooxygenase HmoA